MCHNTVVLQWNICNKRQNHHNFNNWEFKTELLFIFLVFAFCSSTDHSNSYKCVPLTLEGWEALVSISSTFYVQIFCTNVIPAAFSSYILALGRNLYKKCAHKMLMKSTPGVNFYNILRAAFLQKKCYAQLLCTHTYC